MQSVSIPTHPRRDIFVAMLLWAVFALAIALESVFKLDTITLTTDRLVAGRIVESRADAVVLEMRGDSSQGAPARQTIPRDTIKEIAPLGERNVTPQYRKAAQSWWAARPLYGDGLHGFLYLPQFAALYSPLAFLPPIIAEPLWRLLSIGIYALGVRGLCRVLAGNRGLGLEAALFLPATLLAIPPALGSAINGQSNLMLAGVMALAAASIAEVRLLRSSALFALALILKPIAVPFVLLACACTPRLIVRTAILTALALTLLLLHPNIPYALSQLAAMCTKLTTAAEPSQTEFVDQGLIGLLTTLGLRPPGGVMLTVMGIAALLTLGASVLAQRLVPARLSSGAAVLYLLTFAAAYILLLNPRTEGVTYALIGPPAALAGASALVRRRWVAGVALIAYCLILQFSRDLTGGTNYWLRPAATILFLAYVLWQLHAASRLNRADPSAVP